MKFKTILEGEQAVIFNHLGQGRLLKGPARVFLYRERLQKLTHYPASADEYLSVKDKNGFITHVPGPCEMFLNPLKHQQIIVCEATKIGANHVIVVYRQVKGTSVERRIVSGPTVFIPQAEEWLHDFVWHGPNPSDLGLMIPGSHKFTQLSVIPQYFYYNVREVRTTDDTMLTVKLIIFYDIQDVLSMLEATHDPIADIINAVCADVIAFGGKLTLNKFLESVSQFNSLKTYRHLLPRAEKIGFNISKIVYRGYQADEKLQAMQNATIESRTQMRLSTELQEEQQKLAEYKLQKEEARTKLCEEMEQTKADHAQRLHSLSQHHLLQLQKLEQVASRGKQQLEAQTKLGLSGWSQRHDLSYYQRLQELGVDLTRYLVRRQVAPVNEEFRITNPRPPSGLP